VTAPQITEISQFHCKQDMSRWTRAHADAPGITWSVYAGPGGTMIVELEAAPAAPAGSFLDFALA